MPSRPAAIRGVSFDPATAPVVFEAGNYIIERGDLRSAQLLSA